MKTGFPVRNAQRTLAKLRTSRAGSSLSTTRSASSPSATRPRRADSFQRSAGAVVSDASYADIGKKLTGVLGPKRITSMINHRGFLLVTPFGAWAALSFDFGSVQPGIWVLLVF